MFQGLFRQSDFLKFWSARSISWLGSHISFLAIPWTAVMLLNPTPFQMGLLTAVQMLPYLVFGLLIGVWVDRRKRRPLLIMSDIGRGLLLLGIPLLAISNQLSIEILLAIVFLTGTFTVIADISEEAYLPALIGREQLVEGYSKLSASTSATETIGPGIGGVLIEWFTAPIAVIFDALSFLVSGILLLLIRKSEPPPIVSEEATSIKADILEGLGFVIQQPSIRAIIAASVTLQFCGGMFNALLILYITQNLGLPATYFGLIYVIGSVSGLLAALKAEALIDRVGIGGVTIVSTMMISVGWLSIPVSGALVDMPMLPIALGMFITGIGNTLHNITTRTVTQSLTPDKLLGRVNSSSTFLGMGILPIGSFVGGILGTILGTQMTLILAGVGMLFGWLWMFFSPLRQTRTLATSLD